MTAKQIRTYSALLRMAKVNEVRAATALAQAMREERAKAAELERLSTMQSTTSVAQFRRLQEGQSVDMGGYAILSTLGQSLHEQAGLADQRLCEAAAITAQLASKSGFAKRRCERAEEELVARKAERSIEIATRSARDSLETWLGVGKRS